MILTWALNFLAWPQTCLIAMTSVTWPLLVLPHLLCSPCLCLKPWSSSYRSSCPCCSLALNSWCLSALLHVGKICNTKVSSFHRHAWRTRLIKWKESGKELQSDHRSREPQLQEELEEAELFSLRMRRVSEAVYLKDCANRRISCIYMQWIG